VTSYIAAAVKAKVTLVEAHKMGGDCLNYGCVPSKALIKTATLVRQMRHSADYGVARRATLDFAQVMDRVARVVRDIEPHDSVRALHRPGRGRAVTGRARIVDPWHVQITAATAACRH
jgi:pyruvate/2-oxoglutarate dehydrogenase complex dihydrolipoamide dehydrogenase (E3) component